VSILVSASNISKSFAARPLFDGITFAVESGERIGLIGPNGAGKSTLLRIVAGQTSPDSGNLTLQRGLRVGFLEQTPQFASGSTVQSAILEGTRDPSDWECLAQTHEIMSKLSLKDPNTPIQQLSGGWQKRVALGRELVRSPDLLLLDEPTNHLDVEGVLWLEELLANAAFATLTITHDRLFLQRIANRILELDRRNIGGLLSVKGDYTSYLEVKEQLLSSQERREVILKNTLRRETEWLRRGAKARTTKQQARIKRAGDLKSEVEELGFRNQSRTARIEFQSSDKNPKKLIEAQSISKTYDSRLIFSDFDLVIRPGTRIGILGPNGCGKSTLIKTLVGEQEPTSGTVLRSENLSVAYFAQNREVLDPQSTVSKTLCPQGDHVSFQGNRVHIRSYLDRFLFTQGQMDMAVSKLSGGEQSRLLIAKLMLNEANLLVLDEPTNDLDMATLSILEECLMDFPGAVLLVTHDRYFLDQVATQILAFAPEGASPGKIVSFSDLEQWENWHKLQVAKIASDSKASSEEARKRELSSTSSGTGSTNASAPAKKRKLGFNEQRELDSMEENIHKAEKRLAVLTEESSRPENMTNSVRLTELTQEMTQLQTEIDRLYARWAELES
jgi:ATP-binding cassette subfamily F protein uup